MHQSTLAGGVRASARPTTCRRSSPTATRGSLSSRPVGGETVLEQGTQHHLLVFSVQDEVDARRLAPALPSTPSPGTSRAPVDDVAEAEDAIVLVDLELHEGLALVSKCPWMDVVWIGRVGGTAKFTVNQESDSPEWVLRQGFS